MGQREKRERARRRRLAPPTPSTTRTAPPPATSSLDFGNWLGHHGIIAVLFETPSGFALMHYDGDNLFLPANIWSDFINISTAEDVVFLKDFKVFEDKASAINSNGLSPKLAKMIKKSLWPGQKLAVGKKEYKDIIEKSLEIHCLFDEAVLEVMWGLKNLMKVLVPDEKLELTKEDRLQISQGMKLVLDRYGFDVDASLVNSDIIALAYTLYECDVFEDGRAALLQYGRERLEEVSGIDSKNWKGLKLATALKLVCYPEEKIMIGVSEEMLSEADAAKLVADAHRYRDKLHDRTCLVMYTDIVKAHEVRSRAQALLGSMAKEAKDLQQMSMVSMVEDHELDQSIVEGYELDQSMVKSMVDGHELELSMVKSTMEDQELDLSTMEDQESNLSISKAKNRTSPLPKTKNRTSPLSKTKNRTSPWSKTKNRTSPCSKT